MTNNLSGTLSKNVVETPRLLLRPFTPDDARFCHALESDARAKRFVGPTSEKTVEQYREILSQKSSSHSFAVALKEGGAFIGRCGFTYSPVVDALEMHIVLLPDYWRRGFGIEIGTALVDYGFQVLNLDPVFAIIDQDNAPSIALCLKLGMRQRNDLHFRKNARPVLVFELPRPPHPLR